MNYQYDGSFDGFLSCVWHHYRTEKASGISDALLQPDFIHAEQIVETDEEKSDVVRRAISGKISFYDLERIYRVFRTDTEDKEMMLLRYIVLGFKMGARIRLLHGDPIVFAVQKAEQRLGREVERLCGLIRFSVMCPAAIHSSEIPGRDSALPTAGRPEDLLYAAIEPDNDVVEFLATHFCDRFHEDPFLIHDIKRGKALAAYRKKWYVTDFPNDVSSLLKNTNEEEGYRTLWRQYFDTIAIRERTNPKCQRNFMPTRYWKHLTEVNK
jgi:probable DNA metabolism protein